MTMRRASLRRTPALAAIAVASLLAAACSGGLSNPSAVVESGTVAANSAAAAAFDMPSGPASGGREVIAEPKAADLAVVGPLGERALGRPDAPLTVYEYASLTCPYCRDFHDKTFPRIKKAYVDTGKIRWVLREFPIGRASGTAWITTRCAKEEAQFGLYERFLREQPSWVSQEVRPDAIFAVARKAGMSRAEFDSCMANQSIEQGLTWVKERARQLGVSGTPTFFIGVTKARANLSFEEFKAMADPLLAAPKSATSG